MACAKCEKPLEVEIEPDSDDDAEMETTQTFPDDVKLACGCHFHWECLLDSYELTTCPMCSRNITFQPAQGSSSSNSDQRILVDLNNEGGLQEQIDIFPILKEESYLHAYPEERKCRAFLEFCREGDHRAVVDLLHSCSDPDDDGIVGDELNNATSEQAKTTDEILRYQDPIGDMQSGLHAAAANGHREVAWLLLLLASQLPEMEFPALVYQEAATLGIMRDDQDGKTDIRSLTDAYDRTAEDVARETGVVWQGWIGNGRLALP